jgi:hypothetical protein
MVLKISKKIPVICIFMFVFAGCRTSDSNAELLQQNTAEPVQPYKSCIFGEALDELRQNADFTATPKGEVKRVGRMTDSDGSELTFKVTAVKHTSSGSVFFVYETFRDEDDGGNVLGWLEAEANGEIVAEISDSELFNCTVDTTNVAKVPERSEADCAFGERLGDLENSKFFTKGVHKSQVKGIVSKLAGISLKEPVVFTVQEYKQLKTGHDFIVFTSLSADSASLKNEQIENEKPPLLGGTLVGWIEQKKSGQVVGEIIAGEIRRCMLLGNGTLQAAADNRLLSDCEVAKNWDDLPDADGDDRAVVGKKKDEECQPSKDK